MLEQGRDPRGGWRPGRRTTAAAALAGLLVAALSVGALVERRQQHIAVKRPALGPLDWGSHGSLQGDTATVDEARSVWASHDPSTRDSSHVLFAGSKDGVRVVLLIAPFVGGHSYSTAAVTGPPGNMRLARTARAPLTPMPIQLSVVVGTPQRAVLVVVTSPAVQQVSYAVSTAAAPDPSVNAVTPADQLVLTSVPGIWSVTELEIFTATGVPFDGAPGLENAGAPPVPRLLVQQLEGTTAVQLRAGSRNICVVALSAQDPAVPEIVAFECSSGLDLAAEVTPVRTALGYAYGLVSARIERVGVVRHGGGPLARGAVGDIDPATSTRGFLAPVLEGLRAGQLIFFDGHGQEVLTQPLG